MGKKKKLLIKYRNGILSKKLEKKFASFLRANIKDFTPKVVEKVEELLDTTEQIIKSSKEDKPAQVEEPVVEKKPKTTRKRKPTTKKTTTSTTRRKRTTKTKTDA